MTGIYTFIIFAKKEPLVELWIKKACLSGLFCVITLVYCVNSGHCVGLFVSSVPAAAAGNIWCWSPGYGTRRG